MPPDAAATTAARMRRNVWLLFCCQALMNAAMVGQVAMGALIGHSLAGDKALATLPMAVQMTAVMAASIPAGIVFARLGRRAGFILGALLGIVGALTFGLGVWRQDFFLYCLGAVPAGMGFGISQHFRFAAAEVATPEYRSRAIALVMAGGVVSAILGPELVKLTRDLAAPFLFLGTYLILACLPLVCLAVLTVVDLPPAPPRHRPGTEAAPPLRGILARPAFVTAAVTGPVAYGTMNMVRMIVPTGKDLFAPATAG